MSHPVCLLCLIHSFGYTVISPVISCNTLQTDPDFVEDTAEAGLISVHS